MKPKGKNTYHKLSNIKRNSLLKAKTKRNWEVNSIIGLCGGSVELGAILGISERVVAMWPGSKTGIPVKYWDGCLGYLMIKNTGLEITLDEFYHIMVRHIDSNEEYEDERAVISRRIIKAAELTVEKDSK